MKKVLGVLCCVFFSVSLYAEKLNIFVAASARNALTEVKDEFLKTRKNDTIELNFGASGKAYQQFSQGLSYDMFFSADARYAAKIFEDGKAASKPQVYALGVVALYALDSKLIEKGLESIRAQQSSIKHLSIANPKVAPYGVAAEEILKNSQLYDGFKGKIVQGDNISQAVSFVDSGAAEVGLVAYSLVANNPKGKAILIDSNLYTKMEQSFVITQQAKDNPLAKEFAAFVTSESAKAIFKKHGFGTP